MPTEIHPSDCRCHRCTAPREPNQLTFTHHHVRSLFWLMFGNLAAGGILAALLTLFFGANQ